MTYCRRVVWLLSCYLWAACGDGVPEQEAQVQIVIEADSAVRAVVGEVTAVVEGRSADGAGWQTYGWYHFEPQGGYDWPLQALLGVDVDSSYLLTATARDDRGAVVGEVRVLRKLAADQELELRVVFDESCQRLEQLCERSQTCRDGACVDAREQSDDRDPHDRE
jgi:hypothetical protein